MTNKNVNMDMPSPMLWLDKNNLDRKIEQVTSWLNWYQTQFKLEELGKDHTLYIKYVKQAGSLKVILEMLQTIKQYSKTLIED